MSHVEKLEYLFDQCPEGNALCDIQSITLLALNHEQVFPSTIDNTYRLADLILDLDELRAVLENSLAAVKEQLDVRKAEMSETMISLDLPYLPRRGRKLKPSTKVRYSPMGGVGDPNVAAWMKQNGFGDVVKEQIHSSTFNSVVHEAVKENGGRIPDDLEKLVKSFESHSISMTKDPS